MNVPAPLVAQEAQAPRYRRYEEAVPIPVTSDAPSTSSVWMLLSAGLALIAVPVSLVRYGRSLLAKDTSKSIDLLDIPVNPYTKAPNVTDVVSLESYTGRRVDMLINTPNYRVAMVSSGRANTAHIRFAVFALFERFTEKGVRVVMLAQEESRRSGHNYVGTEQMLLGIIGEGTGLAARMLRSHGMDLKSTRGEVSKLIGPGQDLVGVEVPFTPGAKKVLDTSQAQSVELGHNYIGTEHLLLALLEEETGNAALVFKAMRIDCAKVRTEMLEAISDTAAKDGCEVEICGIEPEMAGAGANRTQPGQDEESILDQFAVNLTDRAAKGELDPVVGRIDEVERVIQVLGRRTKNNPCLIGEPGVGKTAIAEGLAQMIVDGNVPENLQGKQVQSLDLSLLIAGTKFRGEFEERLKKVLDEVKANDKIILMIDEVHTLVGAGAAEGAIDAANIMKPGLARGELQVIGATTIAEYRKYIEKDAALERRFQPCLVPEPTPEQAVQILMGLRKRYEEHHKLVYTDEALEAAVNLSHQYISDRFLPDKAIDLMDEAGSCVRFANSKKQQASPIGEGAKLEAELAKLRQQKSLDLKTHDFEHAAIMRTQIAELEEKIKASGFQRKETGAEDKEAVPVVDAAVIASIITKWTGVPIEKVTEEEGKILLNMEEHLHKKVIGQHEAVNGIARALRRARAGMKDPSRPIASMFFMGPTGVGKTQLAKALASSYFGSEEAMVRMDMSEYMERHTVSKLIGSPPGYVGYDEGGQLTEIVRKKPYSLLLFDEIEKAHPDVFNMMLQILEDGRLTDSQGRIVDFKNTMVIMTSNVGSQAVVRGGNTLGFATPKEETSEETSYKSMKANVMESMKAAFKPEFLNRIDEIVVFSQLSKDEVKQVAEIMLADVHKRLQDQGVTLEVTEAFKDRLLKDGWNPTYGARPLRRAINTLLEDALSDVLLKGAIGDGDTVKVDVDEEGHVIVGGKNGEVINTIKTTVPAGIA
jgi:ATP-dependent Clp protease ATP-binding subunit ClpC